MDLDFMNLSPEAQLDYMNMVMQQQKDTTQIPTSSNFPNTPFTSNQFAFHHQTISPTSSDPSLEHNRSSVEAMREMIFRMAAMQPLHIDPESIKPPKRRNVKISKDPQSVAARHRRERISERIRILQRLVPGGTKMDTASMLDEAIHYVKFLKTQVQTLEKAAASNRSGNISGNNASIGYDNVNYSGLCYNNYNY